MRKFLLLLTILTSVSATAQDFKILFVNTETITIGEKDLKKGDVFFESDKIDWKGDKQAMKVLSLSDNKQFVFVSTDFKERKLKSAKDFLIRSNRLSTRGIGSLSSVEKQIGETLYVIDTTRIAIDYAPDKSEFFFLLRDTTRHSLKYKNGHLIIDPGICNGENSLSLDLYFHFADGEEECIIEGIRIVQLPVVIED